MCKFIDLTGQTFGNILVLALVTREHEARYSTRCLTCGRESSSTGGKLRRGHAGCRSCSSKAKHANNPPVGEANANHRTGHCTGGKLSPTYNSWRGAKERCNSPKHKNYEAYKSLWCKEWDDFSKFLEDMGERPDGMELDRIDGAKPYGKDNCRWASNREQLYNRTCTRRFLYEGEQCTALEIIERAGLSGKVKRDQMYGMLSRHTAEEAVAIYKTKLTTKE